MPNPRHRHTVAGQQELVASRVLRHQTIAIGDTATPIEIDADPRNHLLIYNWTNPGRLIFVGGSSVESAGVNDDAPVALTGMPIQPGIYMDIDVTDGFLFGISAAGITNYLSIIELY